MPDAGDHESLIALFLRHVGSGDTAAVRTMLDASPWLASAIGPHPFWGGRPQPLHVAIEANRPDIVDLLLAHGADVNGSSEQYDHWTPLMIAMSRDRQPMRDALIAHGARIGLLEALMMGDDARVDAWLRDEGLPAIAPNGGSILAFARTPFAIDRLIALGAPATTADRWGATPIDAISRLGPRAAPLVHHLVAKGIAATPAEYARVADLETLAQLVAADPGVARLDAVMMAAVDFRHHALAEWLVARGGNVNARAAGQSRHTALHSAAWNGDLAMVQQLVAAGADREARDEEYDATPLGWAETSVIVTNNPACADVVAWLSHPAAR